jgi:hypothetical protein
VNIIVTYGEMDVKVHEFFISMLDKGKWMVSIRGKKPPYTLNRGVSGPQWMQEEKSPLLG